MVHGVVLARIARTEVDDVVQDVFMAAFERLRELREPAAFAGWLAAIARNRAADHGRRLVPVHPVVDTAAPPSTHERLEALAILDAIRSLPEAYSETLVLRLVEGMTGEEIAERTGLTPGFGARQPAPRHEAAAREADMSDYLWDKRGGDPEIERIERALHVFAQATPPPPLDLRRQRSRRRVLSRAPLLIAATLALAVGGAVFMLVERRSAPAWQVTTASGRSTLAVGAWLDTGAAKRTVAVADIGTVTVEPGARVRLLDTRAGHHRMELARGTMHATIWAPPNQFFVETPSTLAVDLGCAYTLDGGRGWRRSRDRARAAGSASSGEPRVVHPGGLGVRDAARHRAGHAVQRALSPAFRQALDDRLQPRSQDDAPSALALVLDQSEERDEVTLWHLLTRVPPPTATACSTASPRSCRRPPASRATASGRATGACSTRGGTRSGSAPPRCGARGASSGRKGWTRRCHAEKDVRRVVRARRALTRGAGAGRAALHLSPVRDRQHGVAARG